MKIALSFPCYHRRDGLGQIASECAGYLAHRQHEITVFSDQRKNASEQAGIKHVRVPRSRFPAGAAEQSYFRNSTHLIKQAEYDALGTYEYTCPVGGVLWVQSVRKARLEASRRLRPSRRWKRMLECMNPVPLRLEQQHFQQRRYRRLISTTHEVKADLHRCYDIPLDDVTVIPNGFSEQQFNPELSASRRQRARDELGLRPDRTILLFAASQLLHQGYKVLLRALQMIDVPRIRILVVGHTDPANVIYQAHLSGLVNQVVDCGPGQDFSRYYAAADLLVLPSRDATSYRPIMEALGSGLPVVTTWMRGVRDVVRPGINGELVEPGQVEELSETLRRLSDPDVRARYAARASDSVREYRWSEVLHQYEKLLIPEGS